MSARIPIIDLQNVTPERLDIICQWIGCFVLTNHGVPDAVLSGVWPGSPQDINQTGLAYFKEMESLVDRLLRLLALALELNEDWFADKTQRPVSALRALSYPDLVGVFQPKCLRASAHSDYGTLTIMRCDSPGLQVKSCDADWLDVPVREHDFVVTLGDLMAIWTNDHWVSPHQRVLSAQSAAARRQSMAFFSQHQ